MGWAHQHKVAGSIGIAVGYEARRPALTTLGELGDQPERYRQFIVGRIISDNDVGGLHIIGGSQRESGIFDSKPYVARAGIIRRAKRTGR